MKRLGWVLLFLCAAAPAQELLRPQEAFRPTARYVDAKTVEVRYDIAPGYYLYRDKFAFGAEPASVKLGKAVPPPGEIVQDEFFGKTEIHRGSVLIRVPVSSATGAWTLVATSQGCAEGRVCYPPTTQRLELATPAKGL